MWRRRFKQFVTEIAWPAHDLTDEYLNELSYAANGYAAPDPIFSLMVFLDECAKGLEEELSERRPGRQYYDALRELLNPAERNEHPHETPEEQKWRGLYVPLLPDERGPESVDGAEAGWQLSELRSALKILAPLEATTADDDAWGELSDRLRGYRSAASRYGHSGTSR